MNRGSSLVNTCNYTPHNAINYSTCNDGFSVVSFVAKNGEGPLIPSSARTHNIHTHTHTHTHTPDHIEANVETAAVQVEQGNKQLEKAVKHKV